MSLDFSSQPYELASNLPPRVVCRCLTITDSEIEGAIQSGAAGTVKEVIRVTGAGSGCTSCHCSIKSMLEAAGYSVRCPRPAGVDELKEAAALCEETPVCDQCPAPSSSPTWVTM